MPFTEDLTRLHELHQRGALSDEEFKRAKERLLDGSAPEGNSRQAQAIVSLNAVRRSRHDRWIAGVCGGISKSTGMEAWLVRLLFAALFLFGGTGLLIYILLWIFVPNE